MRELLLEWLLRFGTRDDVTWRNATQGVSTRDAGQSYRRWDMALSLN